MVACPDTLQAMRCPRIIEAGQNGRKVRAPQSKMLDNVQSRRRGESATENIQPTAIELVEMSPLGKGEMVR